MFDEPSLAVQLGPMSEQELNALPFGVIRLDAELTVRFFSEPEARNTFTTCARANTVSRLRRSHLGRVVL